MSILLRRQHIVEEVVGVVTTEGYTTARDTLVSIGSTAGEAYAESYVAPTHGVLVAVSFYIGADAAVHRTRVDVYNEDGSNLPGTLFTPSRLLARSDVIAAGSLVPNAYNTFYFAAPLTQVKGTTYWVVIAQPFRTAGGDATEIGAQSGAPYSGGAAQHTSQYNTAFPWPGPAESYDLDFLVSVDTNDFAGSSSLGTNGDAVVEAVTSSVSGSQSLGEQITETLGSGTFVVGGNIPGRADNSASPVSDSQIFVLGVIDAPSKLVAITARFKLNSPAASRDYRGTVYQAFGGNNRIGYTADFTLTTPASGTVVQDVSQPFADERITTAGQHYIGLHGAVTGAPTQFGVQFQNAGPLVLWRVTGDTFSDGPQATVSPTNISTWNPYYGVTYSQWMGESTQTLGDAEAESPQNSASSTQTLGEAIAEIVGGDLTITPYALSTATSLTLMQGTTATAQAVIVPAAGSITGFSMGLVRILSPTDDLVFEVRADDGTGTKPSGSAIASATIAGSTVPTTPATGAEVAVTFSRLALAVGTYWVSVHRTVGDNTNYYSLANRSAGYAGKTSAAASPYTSWSVGSDTLDRWFSLSLHLIESTQTITELVGTSDDLTNSASSSQTLDEAVAETFAQSEAASQSLTFDASADTQSSSAAGSQTSGEAISEAVGSDTQSTQSLTDSVSIAEAEANSADATQSLSEVIAYADALDYAAVSFQAVDVLDATAESLPYVRYGDSGWV